MEPNNARELLNQLLRLQGKYSNKADVDKIREKYGDLVTIEEVEEFDYEYIEDDDRTGMWLDSDRFELAKVKKKYYIVRIKDDVFHSLFSVVVNDLKNRMQEIDDVLLRLNHLYNIDFDVRELLNENEIFTSLMNSRFKGYSFKLLDAISSYFYSSEYNEMDQGSIHREYEKLVKRLHDLYLELHPEFKQIIDYVKSKYKDCIALYEKYQELSESIDTFDEANKILEEYRECLSKTASTDSIFDEQIADDIIYMIVNGRLIRDTLLNALEYLNNKK